MKKIFAIALALVMVLSMASAFAAVGNCGISWTYPCTTYSVNCGVAKAEVVKFVRQNGCNWEFVENNACAGVVVGERVYYGVKVTFDKDVNKDWFDNDATKLVVTVKDLAGAVDLTGTAGDYSEALHDKVTPATGKTAYETVKDGGVFWLNMTTGMLVADDDFSEACVKQDAWAKKTSAKVCANVEYEFDGLNTWIDFGAYKVYVKADDTAVEYIQVNRKASGESTFFNVVDETLVYIEAEDGTIYGALENGKFIGASMNANNEIVYATAGESCSYLADMMKFLQINFRDCVTRDACKANFGWDDKDVAKSCVTWNADAQSIVNAECVVAIPKTGDASVLAWLF